MVIEDLANFIQFSDPDRLIGFTIVNENTPDRWLTGGDIDPESLQVDPQGDLWVGDEFGPWILHFDDEGRLLEKPIPLPGNLDVAEQPAPGRGEAVAAQQPWPRGHGHRRPVPVSDAGGCHAGRLDANATSTRRLMFEYDINTGRFTGRQWVYRVDPAPSSSPTSPLSTARRFVVIERDGAPGTSRREPPGLRRGSAATSMPQGNLVKHQVLDLAAIPDPDLVSLPPIHVGDVGLGNPFRVICESVEAIRVIDRDQVLVGCDNNFPNMGRNPSLADDNEFMVIEVPELSDRR